MKDKGKYIIDMNDKNSPPNIMGKVCGNIGEIPKFN